MKYLAKRGVTLLFLLLGIVIGLLAEVGLRVIIQELYIALTGGRISFIGKNFRLFAADYYYLAFGLWAGSLWLLNRKGTFKQATLALALTTLTFFLMLVLLCTIDSQLKLVECTACDDGTRQLQIINDMPYDLLITFSLLASLLPSVWGRRKRHAQQSLKTIEKRA